ncbi:MAG: S9 family peptidase [Aestuariibacter sp.]
MITRQVIGPALLFSMLGLSTGCTDIKKEQVADTLPTTHSYLPSLEQPAPTPARIEHTEEWHGITLSDPFHWLKDQGYPEIDDEPVLDYLNQENAYFDAFIKPHEPLVNTLFEEMKGRLDETEESVPYVSNGYVYRWYYKEGANYKTYVRKPIEGGTESDFLDEEKLAEGKEYFVLSDFAVSPDNKLVAYTIDTEGDERYQVHVKNLETGDVQEALIGNSDGAVNFSSDSQTLIYGKLNEVRWRTEEVVAFDLKSNQSKVLFRDLDDQFFISFGLSSDKQYLLVSARKGGISEVAAIPADDMSAEPVILAPRDKEFRYSVDHAHGKFYILANDSHVNFRLATATDEAPQYENWTTEIAGNDKTYLKGIKTFNDFMLIYQSENAYEQLIVNDYASNSHKIAFPEKMISVRLGENYDFNQKHVRINYESFLTPDTVYDYQVATKELVSQKVKKIPSGYDKALYETKRLMATARDGVEVPVSIMYKKGIALDGSNPLHLIGYGAYAFGYPTTFSTVRLSMLDRGVVVGIAHIRGGDEMGYQWYLDGKFKQRKNTFNDFVDSAKYLIDQGYTSAGNISISGRSAGGELMGAAVIQAPELWSSVMLGVPFVDVLNTILDASLPLTPPEWEEWGNPIESKEYFEFIRSYSPYDNIVARDYPPMLVTGGLNDPRVTYWEPAKFTAKMRHLKTDDNLLVMRMNMGAGHFANSGRYGRLKDYAQEYAFSLLSHGIDK